MRKTRIVATVGPSCAKESSLKSLLGAGADILRINASHTTPARLAEWIHSIRRVSASMNKTVGILVDLQGPRVRTGALKGLERLLLKKGDDLWIAAGVKENSGAAIATPCREFPGMVKKGDPVLIDNGLLELQVLSVEKRRVRCRVIRGGYLGANKGINLPHAPVTLPPMTAKDLADLEVAARLDVDFIALSFVRSKSDVEALKKWLKRRRKEIQVIAKIEKPSAVKQISSILEVADGIMVARGDLGIEMGVEKVPAVQKQLIARAHQAQLPVITATQMLETMMESPRPTRAEVSDVANAVFDGTDAVMLSGETSIGKYPIPTVRTMATIIREAERHSQRPMHQHTAELASKKNSSPVYAITQAALEAAEHSKARAIVVFTRSGKTARLISVLSPACPIIIMTASERINRQLTLLKGVLPLRMKQSANTDEMIRNADAAILKAGLLKRGDVVVVVSGKQALPAARYMAKIHLIGERFLAR